MAPPGGEEEEDWEAFPVCNKCTLGRVVVHEIPEARPEELVAMQVLARHVVRLGGSGPGLESAVLRAYRAAPAGCARWRRWSFLSRQGGLRAYLEEKWRTEQVYAKCGRAVRRSDEEVRKGLPLDELSQAFPKRGEGDAQSPEGSKGEEPREPVGESGRQKIHLPITGIRFAHDSQREHFGHLASAKTKASAVQRGVLQLAVEVLMGLTDPTAVPKFNVCKHDGLWYSYTGNRRLAAFRLAHSFAPARVSSLKVRVVEANEFFFRGEGSFPARYTTERNGPDCAGRWLIVKETGEAVGSGMPVDPGAYGFDLLSLLPLPDGLEPLAADQLAAEQGGPEATDAANSSDDDVAEPSAEPTK